MQDHIEDYLCTIYRLRENPGALLPLSRLQEYLKYTPISIHEMIQKLEKKSLVYYVPYQGVTLTKSGENLASAIIRRHRIWECFLTDSLMITWEQAHEIAGRLEHAASEIVTEQLSDFLENPQHCPHGNPIPTKVKNMSTSQKSELGGNSKDVPVRLDLANPGVFLQIISISPENSKYLQKLKGWGILPGATIQIVANRAKDFEIKVRNTILKIPKNIVQTVWACEI